MAKRAKEVKPIVIHNEDTGETYTLDFDRASIKHAESKGFAIEEIGKYPMKAEDLFYYAFRKNHPTIPREKTMSILYDDLGGLSEAMITRLGELYAAPFEALFAKETNEKNSHIRVEM